MPSYPLPTFNVPFRIWRRPDWPAGPFIANRMANLAFGRRVQTAGLGEGSEDAFSPSMYLLCPIGEDIRGDDQAAGGDIVEVPQYSGRLYQVEGVDDAGGGFANEHRVAIIEKLQAWPVPYPIVGHVYPPPPPPPSPFVPLGGADTTGIPAAALVLNVVVPAPGGDVFMACNWENAGFAPVNAAGFAFFPWSAQNQNVGLVRTDLALFVMPSVPAGPLAITINIPGIGGGTCRAVAALLPAAVHNVDGNTSGVGLGMVVTGSTLLTSMAPGRVAVGFAEANPTGGSVITPAGATLIGLRQEAVAPDTFRLLLTDQPAAVNGVYTAGDSGGMPFNGSLWFASLLA